MTWPRDEPLDLTDGRAVASAVAQHLQTSMLCAVGVELGLANGRRLDVVGLTQYGTIRAVEVKVSRADFFADKKIAYYLHYCDYLHLAVPEDMVSLLEFADWAGLIHPRPGLMYVAANHGVKVVRKAEHQGAVPFPNRIDVIHRMAMRAGDPGFCPHWGWRRSRVPEPETVE